MLNVQHTKAVGMPTDEETWAVSFEAGNPGEADATLVLGEPVFGVIVEFIGIGDLFTAGVDAFPKEDVEAVLKAGLAADGGVPKAPTLEETGAGVLMTTGVGAFVLGRTGLKLLALRMGVSLWFDARTGDADSCQLGPTWFKLSSSFLSLLLLLLILGPFCSLISSNELLFVTEKDRNRSVSATTRGDTLSQLSKMDNEASNFRGYAAKVVPGGELVGLLVKSCLATELMADWDDGIGPKSSLLESRESPRESCWHIAETLSWPPGEISGIGLTARKQKTSCSQRV